MKCLPAITARIVTADTRYGPFSSAHEAYGVCMEEMHELTLALHANDLESQRKECLDLAAALIRWSDGLTEGSEMARRSIK